MSKIKMIALLLTVAFTFGACATVKFSGAAEGVDSGSYYLPAMPIARGDNKQTERVPRGRMFKCIASSELEWTCAEIAVVLSDK